MAWVQSPVCDFQQITSSLQAWASSFGRIKWIMCVCSMYIYFYCTHTRTLIRNTCKDASLTVNAPQTLAVVIVAQSRSEFWSVKAPDLTASLCCVLCIFFSDSTTHVRTEFHLVGIIVVSVFHIMLNLDLSFKNWLCPWKYVLVIFI